MSLQTVSWESCAQASKWRASYDGSNKNLDHQQASGYNYSQGCHLIHHLTLTIVQWASSSGVA